MRRVSPANGWQQGGFALVAAIFIVVVLALLGIMMVTIGGLQRATASAAVQGARAYHAARSGIEWGIYRAVVDGNCAVTGPPLGPPTPPTFTLAVAGLNGFNVWVNCSLSPPGTQHQEHGPPPYNVYVITSTATSGAFGAPDYVMRTLQASVTTAPAP